MNKTGVIYGINGPVVYLKGNTGFKMSEMVLIPLFIGYSAIHCLLKEE